jgi:hypothetical protein
MKATRTIAACALVCACTAEPKPQSIEQVETSARNSRAVAWAGWTVQPDQATPPSPPPSPPPAAESDLGPQIELIEEDGCTYPKLAGLPSISEDGEFVTFKQWDFRTELLEIVFRPLASGDDTRVTLSTAADNMCFDEPAELATLDRRVDRARRELARKRWRSMIPLSYHVDFVRDLGRDDADCPKLDLSATANALQQDWPANLGSRTWLLTCANQPRVIELLFLGPELVIREPGIAVLARLAVPEATVASLVPGECAPKPQIAQAWFDEQHHVVVAMVTQRDLYMCEYPYQMIDVRLDLTEPHAPLAFPPDPEVMQSETVLRHLDASD